MKNKILFFLFLVFAAVAYSQQSYTQAEVDLKLQLQQKELDAKLQELKNEKEKSDLKIEEQDKRLLETQNRLSKLVDIFGILLAVITIAATVGGFFIESKNQSKRKEMVDQFEILRTELERDSEQIAKQAQLVAEKAQLMVEKAAVEIEVIRSEGEEYLEELDTLRNMLDSHSGHSQQGDA